MPTYPSRNGVREHRFVWEEDNGPVPVGHHIHHKDENKSNNSLSNLELLTHAEHNRRHHLGTHHSNETRAKMSASQSTPEARAIKSKTHRGRKQSTQQIARRRAAMVEFYAAGGSIGKLAPKERSDRAAHAARARWG